MDEYIQHGFLPRLTHASFRFYATLLSAIRQLAFDHSDQPWNKGPAQAMLAFHLDRLLQICSHALTRKALILQSYCYSARCGCEGLLLGVDDRIIVEPTGRTQHQRQQDWEASSSGDDFRRLPSAVPSKSTSHRLFHWLCQIDKLSYLVHYGVGGSPQFGHSCEIFRSLRLL
jgi:hypothetical protein